MTLSPTAHLWLTVPSSCQFGGEIVSVEDLRVVFGNPRTDGHTIDFDRRALERFRDFATALLERDLAESDSVLVSSGC